MHNLIADGYIGRCYHCNFRFFAGFSRDTRYRWRYDRRRANGCLADLGAHMIDLARWYVGDIARVSAHLTTSVGRDGIDGQPLDPANDSAVMTVAFANGSQGVIHVSAVAHCGTSMVELHGESGTLSALVTFGGGTVQGARHDEPGIHALPIPDELWGDASPTRSLDVLTQHPVGERAFIDAILADRPVTPNFYDGWKAQEVIEGALTSHRSECWVDLA
jgi:predicted dehydrogenase